VLRWNNVFKFHTHSRTVVGAAYLLIGGNIVVTMVAVIDSGMHVRYHNYITYHHSNQLFYSSANQ
jgi:hypothetical protein